MENISNNFKQELRKKVHTVVVKAELLDTDLKPVPAGTFYNEGSNEIQNYIIDGEVVVDVESSTRRTATLTLRNDIEDFTPNDPVTGKFYLNRIIRLYRGIQFPGGAREYCLLGTFMIDHVETVVERNMSTVVIKMSDMWKKLNKSYFGGNGSAAAGTNINNVIRTVVSGTGSDYPLPLNLDPLTGPERNQDNRTITKKITWERGDNKGEFLRDLAAQYGIDIFFNVEGRFTTNDRLDPKDLAPVWSFYNAEEGGMLVSVVRSFNDDNLYNKVVAVGTGNEKNIVRHAISDTNKNSPTNINRIGERTLYIENDKIDKQAKIEQAAKRAWNKRFNIAETIDIRTICNPALDGDDVIHIKEPMAKLNGNYRISSMSISLTTSLQDIRVLNIIKE